MTMGNEADVANTDFELLIERFDKFLCLTLFRINFKICSYFYNYLSNCDGVMIRMKILKGVLHL